MDRLSELVIEEENYIKKVVERTYNDIKLEENEGIIILDLKKFNILDNIIKSNLILYITQKIFGTSKGLEKKHVEDIIKLCGNNIGNKYLTPNKGFKIIVKNKKVHFKKI